MPSANRKHIPMDVQRHIWARDGGMCVWCSSTESVEIDHITPLVLGGTDSPDNLRLLCREHNEGRNRELKAGLVKVVRTTWVSRSGWFKS